MRVQIIKNIAEALPVTESPNTFATFKHGEKEWQNFISDEITGVRIFLDEPIRSNDNVRQGGLIEESYPLFILFADKSEVDWTPEQHEVVISQMRTLSNRFINRLNSDNGVRSFTSVSKQEVKNVYDTNLSGVIISITITPFSNYTACQ
jgi:hypothetical protein